MRSFITVVRLIGLALLIIMASFGGVMINPRERYQNKETRTEQVEKKEEEDDDALE